MYYAVKVGVKPGIYKTWDECKANVNGYKGAIYKKFNNLEDAENFQKGLNDIKEDIDEQDKIILFVDGSYDDSLKSIGCGIYIQFRDLVKKYCYNPEVSKEVLNKRNEAGELIATIKGLIIIDKIIKNGLLPKKDIIIFNDYMGISNYINGNWSTKEDFSRKYKESFFKIKNEICVDIKFKHIKSHTGNKRNEIVDKLAKKALNIEKNKLILID